MAGVVTVVKAAREGGAVWGVAVDSGRGGGREAKERWSHFSIPKIVDAGYSHCLDCCYCCFSYRERAGHSRDQCITDRGVQLPTAWSG